MIGERKLMSASKRTGLGGTFRAALERAVLRPRSVVMTSDDSLKVTKGSRVSYLWSQQVWTCHRHWWGRRSRSCLSGNDPDPIHSTFGKEVGAHRGDSHGFGRPRNVWSGIQPPLRGIGREACQVRGDRGASGRQSGCRCGGWCCVRISFAGCSPSAC